MRSPGKTRGLWRLVIITVLIGTCFVGTRAWLLGPTVREVISTEPSPTGGYVAYLERVDRGGGATVGFVFELVVVPASKGFDKDRDKTWIWSAYSTTPASYYWKDSQTVAVVLSRSEEPRLTSIKTKERYGIKAEVLVVK